MKAPPNCRRPLRKALARIVLAIGTLNAAPFGDEARAQPTETTAPAFGFDRQADRITVTLSGTPIADFVFADPEILRPYLANIRLPNGPQVTRRHPPVAPVDAVDHASMHPGIWLAFGDINGHDFWRNRGRIELTRFLKDPRATPGELAFATEDDLLAADGQRIGRMQNALVFARRESGWRVHWRATFLADAGELVLGDQEEMGFGARCATALIESQGGQITNSAGMRTAAKTWGAAADWSDCSGTVDGQPCGLTLMADPTNFRPSWWHNRDYGLLVANPFGRAALKQGEPSRVIVKQGDSLQLSFAAVIHQGIEYDAAAEFQDFADSEP